MNKKFDPSTAQLFDPSTAQLVEDVQTITNNIPADFTNAPIDPSQINFNIPQTPEQKTQQQITERTSPEKIKSLEKIKEKRLQRETLANKIRSGEIKGGLTGVINKGALGTESFAKSLESEGIVGKTINVAEGLSSLSPRAFGAGVRAVTPGLETKSISDPNAPIFSGLRNEANKSIDEWTSSASKDEVINALAQLNSRIESNDKLSDIQKKSLIDKNNNAIEELKSNKPGILKKAVGGALKLVIGVGTTIPEDPLLVGTLVKGIKGLAGIGQTFRKGKQLEAASAVTPSETIDKLAEIKNIETSDKVKILLTEQLAQDNIRKQALKEAEQKAVEFKAKMSNPKNEQLIKEHGYTLDEVKDLETNWKGAENTAAQEFATSDKISISEGTISDLLSKGITTRRGQQLGEISKATIRDPRFNALHELESNVPVKFSEFESQGNKSIDNLFKELDNASTNEVYGIIEKAFPNGNKALFEDIKNALSDVSGISFARGKVITADQLRDIEQKLNSLLRPVYEGSPESVTIANDYLKTLKQYISKNREDLVARELEIKSPGSGKQYYDLNTSAANDLHDESALINDIFKGKKIDLAHGDTKEVKNAIADYLDKTTTEYAKEGLGYDPKGIEILSNLAEKAGIPNFREKFNHLVLVKKTQALSHIPKGVKVTAGNVIPKNLAKGKGVVGSIGNILANVPMSGSTRAYGRILKEWKGSADLDMKDMFKMAKGKAKGDIGVYLLTTVPARILSNALTKEDIDSLKMEYKDNQEIQNKLKTAQSISLNQ